MNSIEKLKGVVSKGQGFARPNLYRIILPSTVGGSTLPIVGELINRGVSKLKDSIDPQDINMLCSAVNMPGRQLNTHERRIGMINRKVAYGFTIEDITLTFRVLNDYKIKEYFEEWMNSAVTTDYELKYFNDYTADVIIQGLTNDPGADYDKLLRLSQTGLDKTSLGLVLGGGEAVTYTCLLQNAYPTSVAALSYTDAQSEVLELNVQLSYTDWKRKLSNPDDARQSIRSKIVEFGADFFNSKIGFDLI